MSASSNLTFALYHAIAYLTRSLIGRYSATTIDLLHFTLERNLTKQFESNWYPAEPHRGSGRRCLTLTPQGVPPRSIYYACKSARISWEDWMRCLGNIEMDLSIDPGCVSVRFAGVSKAVVVWSAKAELQNRSRLAEEQQATSQNTLDEDDEEELFNMIRDEVRSPTWSTPTLSQFPAIPRPTVRLVLPSPLVKMSKPASPEPESAVSTISTSSLLSTHSRSSSRSSDTSSDFSFSSVESAGSAATTVSCAQSPLSAIQRSKDSSNDPALLPASSLIMQAPVFFDDEELEGAILIAPRRARVHVDVSKTDVTPYDGGKTTVLTGGVMLGMKASAPPTPSTPRFAATPQAAFRKTVWRKPAGILVHA